MSDRHGERPDTPADQPAPTITGKARTDTLRVKRTATMRERERPVDRPAPALSFGHNASGWEWVLNRRQTDVPTVTGDRPAPTLTAAAGAKSIWQWERPATTVCADASIGARCHHDEEHRSLGNPKTTEQVQAGEYEGTEAIKLTVTEALLLQGFPVDYPVQGSRTKQFEQVGNAVPPALAAAIVAALIGTTQ